LIERAGDLWQVGIDTVVITTNGFVKKDGRAVMGRGCAREARDNLTSGSLPIDQILGYAIRQDGNHVHDLGSWKHVSGRRFRILTFPVKTNWWEDACPELIERSAGELDITARRMGLRKVAMPQPGCGNGRLSWDEVKPLLSCLDGRFVVCDYAPDRVGSGR
jgi:hypothetical protein